MKKSILLAILVCTLFLMGCTSQEKDSLKFKEEYESLNGTTSSSGKEHRSISISENNPFVYATAEEIVEKIENGETFYVYFGSKLCPWCRSVIEKVIEVANDKKISTIYYVDIWDEEGNEILRDQYTLLEDGLELTVEGTETYYKLLDLLDNILPEYNLTDAEGNSISTNEKRIYAPNFIYIENGTAVRLTTAISTLQTDSRGELTEEILQEEEILLNEFFEN